MESLFSNTAVLMLFTFPVMTAIYSVIAAFVVKDKYIVTGIVLITYLILARFIFGKEFLAWIVVYTLLSFIITWIFELLTTNRKGKVLKESV